MLYSSTYGVLGLPDSLAITFVLVVLALSLAPYLPGKDFGVFKVPKFGKKVTSVLKFVGPGLFILSLGGFFPIWRAAAPPEARYSIQFENLSLVAAVRDLDKRATEVEIVLSPDLESGKVATRRFSISLQGATLSEVLTAFCEKAGSAAPLTWRLSGRTVIIEARSSSRP